MGAMGSLETPRVAVLCVRTFSSAGASLGQGVALAQAPPVEFVQLSPGGAALTQSGLLDSRTRDDQAYVFRGTAGQVLEVELRSSNPDVSFDVAPAGTGSALVNSSITGENHWTGRLPSSGDYTVRVYLQRSAARRGVTATYWLSLGLRAATPAPASRLAGTTWQLVRIQAMDDRTVVLRAGQREKYTLSFGTDGRVALRADCNRGQGTWSSAGGTQLLFGDIAMTRAACAPGALDDRFLRDLSYVRSYMQRGGRSSCRSWPTAGSTSSSRSRARGRRGEPFVRLRSRKLDRRGAHLRAIHAWRLATISFRTCTPSRCGGAADDPNPGFRGVSTPSSPSVKLAPRATIRWRASSGSTTSASPRYR